MRSGDVKCHYGSLSRAGAYRNQTTNEVLAKGPLGLQTHLYPSGVICLVLECIIGRDILGSWHNPHIELLACGVRTIIVEKVVVDYEISPFPAKQYCIQRRIVKISATFEAAF